MIGGIEGRTGVVDKIMYRDALHLKTTVGYWDHLQNDGHQIAMYALVEIIQKMV